MSVLRPVRRIDEEGPRLKHVVADLTLDNQALKAVLGKQW
jgi:hypothetical protein